MQNAIRNLKYILSFFFSYYQYDTSFIKKFSFFPSFNEKRLEMSVINYIVRVFKSEQNLSYRHCNDTKPTFDGRKSTKTDRRITKMINGKFGLLFVFFIYCGADQLSELQKRCPPFGTEGPNSLVVHLPNPKECKSFFKCNHGKLVKFQCPIPLHFNAKLEVTNDDIFEMFYFF